MSMGKGRAAPLHIRSQCLDRVKAEPTGSGLSAFSVYSAEQPAARTRPGHWRERDLRRALAVARQAGLKDYRVELAPDGTIAIVVGR